MVRTIKTPSVPYAAAKLWNDLPENFRKASSFNHFRSLLKPCLRCAVWSGGESENYKRARHGMVLRKGGLEG
ncbi:hypothetical protein DPMN_087449 [Dreissena polymorpha]|uniref:Uncharacterized protein n=1 Tax=Dreissena polymorpha TaxID=45954 RepID=A0A9D4QWW9_DREPO|nr:hypothetical protein DPMN_087449 [Dreissena polymorpha]